MTPLSREDFLKRNPAAAESPQDRLPALLNAPSPYRCANRLYVLPADLRQACNRTTQPDPKCLCQIGKEKPCPPTPTTQPRVLVTIGTP